MFFGNRLKELRLERGLQQEDIAKILNIHRATISRYENNQREPDVNTIINLAQYFEVSSDWLLGITNIKVSIEKLNNHAINLQKIYEIYCQLSKENQELLITFADFLATRPTTKHN